MVMNVIKGKKSCLDNLIKVLENMTDEEIVIATKNTSTKSDCDDDIDLSDFEFEYAPIQPKSTKKVMLLDLNQYSKLKRLVEIGSAVEKFIEKYDDFNIYANDQGAYEWAPEIVFYSLEELREWAKGESND